MLVKLDIPTNYGKFKLYVEQLLAKCQETFAGKNEFYVLYLSYLLLTEPPYTIIEKIDLHLQYLLTNIDFLSVHNLDNRQKLDYKSKQLLIKRIIAEHLKQYCTQHKSLLQVFNEISTFIPTTLTSENTNLEDNTNYIFVWDTGLIRSVIVKWQLIKATLVKKAQQDNFVINSIASLSNAILQHLLLNKYLEWLLTDMNAKTPQEVRELITGARDVSHGLKIIEENRWLDENFLIKTNTIILGHMGMFMLFWVMTGKVKDYLLINLNDKKISLNSFAFKFQNQYQLLPQPTATLHSIWSQPSILDSRNQSLMLFRLFIHGELKRHDFYDLNNSTKFYEMIICSLLEIPPDNFSDDPYPLPLDILRNPQENWQKFSNLNKSTVDKLLQCYVKLAMIEFIKEDMKDRAINGINKKRLLAFLDKKHRQFIDATQNIPVATQPYDYSREKVEEDLASLFKLAVSVCIGLTLIGILLLHSAAYKGSYKKENIDITYGSVLDTLEYCFRMIMICSPISLINIALLFKAGSYDQFLPSIPEYIRTRFSSLMAKPSIGFFTSEVIKKHPKLTEIFLEYDQQIKKFE